MTIPARPVLGDPAPFSYKEPEAIHIDGLTVERIPLDGTEVVPVVAIVPSGWGHERVESAGAVRLATSVRQEGTISFPGTKMAEEMALIGTSLSSQADYERTALALVVTPDDVDRAAELLVSLITEPQFTDDAVSLNRTRAIADAQMLAANPASLASRAFWRIQVPDSSDRRHLPPEGTIETLAELDSDALSAALTPEGGRSVSTLLTGGPLGMEATETIGRLRFTPLAPNAAATPLPVDLPRVSGRVEIVNRPAGPQVQLHFGTQLAGTSPEDRAAARLGIQVLAGSMNSRLSARLREDLGITYGVYGRVMERAGREFTSITTSVQADAAPSVFGEIRSAFELLVDAGVTAAEVATAQGEILGGAALEHQTTAAIFNTRIDQLVRGISVAEANARRAALGSLDAAAVSEYVRREFDPALPTFTVVGDAAVLEPLVRAAYPDVEVTVSE